MKDLLFHFDTAFAAPGGIKKLRELILTLAMQGKLVPQDPKDQPASELLKQIEAEKQRLVKEGKIKKSEPLPEIKPEEVPYELPKGWVWVRVGSVFNTMSGTTFEAAFERDSGSFAYIKVGDMNLPGNEFIITTSSRFIDPDEKMRRVLIPTGSIIFPKRGGAIATNKKRIVQDPIFVDLNTMAITPEKGVMTEYAYHWIRNIDLATLNTGTSVPQINHKDIDPLLFPLPPLPEQRRIVARIDQLMTRCDELERLHAEREQKRLAVHTAVIKQLLDAQEQDSFASAWQFITRHFSELYSVKENVAELRKAILQLAVMGKLVPQNPNDPPASELLKEIEKEKQRLVKEGKIKTPKPMPEIRLEEAPHALPNGWEWVRLEALTQVITKGSSPNWQGVQYVDEGEGILFITSENVGNYDLLLDKKKYVESKFNEIEPRSILKKRDLLMNIVGASIGRTAIFDLDETANINQAVTIIRLINLLDYDYFLHFFNSPICIGYMYDKQVDNARPNLSMGNIALFKIPLPPLLEQHRIVAKVDQLIILCDMLDRQIDAATGKQTELLNAVMAQV